MRCSGVKKVKHVIPTSNFITLFVFDFPDIVKLIRAGS